MTDITKMYMARLKAFQYLPADTPDEEEEAALNELEELWGRMSAEERAKAVELYDIWLKNPPPATRVRASMSEEDRLMRKLCWPSQMTPGERLTMWQAFAETTDAQLCEWVGCGVLAVGRWKRYFRYPCEESREKLEEAIGFIWEADGDESDFSNAELSDDLSKPSDLSPNRRLRLFRKSLWMPLKPFAEPLGVTASWLARVERGPHRPNQKFIDDLKKQYLFEW